MPPKDSIANTFLVSIILCVVCSLLVSSAAVMLKPLQKKNKELDVQRNILAAAGLTADRDGEEIPADDMNADEIAQVFEARVTRELVDLESGDYVQNPDATFDPRKAAKDADSQIKVEGSFDIGQSYRESKTWVYLIKDGDDVQQIIVPVYGMGLWSTLYGYVAVDKDLRTIKGLTYYEHAETPGLGGEVENPAWKRQWIGKKIYEDGVAVTDVKPEDIRVGVAKGSPTGDDAEYMVDGLSGATITSRGVDSMLKYWFSSEGFGPYFQKLASQQAASASNEGAS